MPADKTMAISELLAIGFGGPLLGLGILAVVARIWKPDLRATLPWLRALRWIAWILGALLVAQEFLGLHTSSRLFFALGAGLVTASVGLGVVEGWVKRRSAHETVLDESPDGYWPSPRDQ